MTIVPPGNGPYKRAGGVGTGTASSFYFPMFLPLTRTCNLVQSGKELPVTYLAQGQSQWYLPDPVASL